MQGSDRRGPALARLRPLRCGSRPFRSAGGNRSAVRRTRRHGIWLNHGEFEKLVRYLEGVLLAKPASELTRDALRGAMDKIYQFSPLT